MTHLTDAELDEIEKKIRESVITGNTHFYLRATNNIYAVISAARDRNRLEREAAQARDKGLEDVLAFLNSIEGAGYGGMAAYENVREIVRHLVEYRHTTSTGSGRAD